MEVLGHVNTNISMIEVHYSRSKTIAEVASTLVDTLTRSHHHIPHREAPGTSTHRLQSMNA